MSSADWTSSQIPQSRANLIARSRSSAAFHAIAAWVRRALAEWGRALALAAGVPPHLYD